MLLDSFGSAKFRFSDYGSVRKRRAFLVTKLFLISVTLFLRVVPLEQMEMKSNYSKVDSKFYNTADKPV